MKAAAFDYHRPDSKAAALDLAGCLENAKFLAGGQSLVAMLNMRYAIVDHLIDINRIPELAGITFSDGMLRVGAMTRQKDLKGHGQLARRAPIFAAALDHVGHLQTRNRGTIGGSLGHMDPAAELMGLAVLHDATVHVESANGARDLMISDYPLSYMTPNIEPDEMITAVSFRLPQEDHGWSFREFAQRHGDFAVVGVAALVEMAGSVIGRVALSIFGIGLAPIRATAAEELLAGEAPSAELFRAAAETLGDAHFSSDAMASGAYRRRLAGVLVRRCLEEGVARAQQGGS